MCYDSEGQCFSPLPQNGDLSEEAQEKLSSLSRVDAQCRRSKKTAQENAQEKRCSTASVEGAVGMNAARPQVIVEGAARHFDRHVEAHGLPSPKKRTQNATKKLKIMQSRDLSS